LDRFPVEPGNVGGEADLEPEPFAIVALAEADLGGNGGLVGQLDLVLSGDEFHGAQEAGGIAGGKELFGVGARPARAAHLPGGRKPDIDLAVIGLRMPILAAAGGGGAGGIENFHDRSPIVLRTQSGRVTQWGRGRFALPPTLAAGTG